MPYCRLLLDASSSEFLTELMAQLFAKSNGKFVPQETHGDHHPYHITLIGGIRLSNHNVDQGVQLAMEKVAATVAPISATLGLWQVNKTGLVMIKVPQCFNAACVGLLLADALPSQYSRNCWYHQNATPTATPNLHVTVGYFHGSDKKHFQDWLNHNFCCVDQMLMFNQIEFENDQHRPNLSSCPLNISADSAADAAISRASAAACECAKFGNWAGMFGILEVYGNISVENVWFIDMYPRNFGMVHQAAYHGRHDILKELLEKYEANPQLWTIDGRSVGQIAHQLGHSNVLSMGYW